MKHHIAGAALGIVLALLAIQAWGQDVPRPNTELQTGIGVPEILTNSLPGGGTTTAPQPQPVSSAPVQQAQAAAPDGFDPGAYYKAKADFARERMQWEEIEAQRYARFSARLNMGGGGSAGMGAIVETAMSGCSAKESAGGGFWANIGNRMGRSKECREQQTTARFMMCNMMAIELQNAGIVQHCVQIAENDNAWIPFWTQALRSGVTLAGIHYGAGVLSDVIGLGRFAVDAGVGTAQQSIANQPDPIIVPPTIVETPAPQVVQPEVIQVGSQP